MNASLLANGRRIAYYHFGSVRKLPIVFLHGFCADSRMWRPLLPLLRGRRMLCIDLPGFGGSDPALSPGLVQYADAVCNLLNELAVERCILIGHSMGGYTALEFAALYPERLAGLGLFHSHPYPDTSEKKENRLRGIEQIKAGKKSLYVQQLFNNLFSPAFAEAHPDTVEKMIRRGKQQSDKGIIAALENMYGRRDHTDTLEKATFPVLYILGDADTTVTLETALPATHLPAVSDVHILPGVAHMGMFEDPETSATILLNFYKLCRKAL